MSSEQPTSKALIRLAQVQVLVPYSRSTIYQLIAKGEFPAPVKLGLRASAWLECEVQAWVADRIAGRDSLRGGGHDC